MRRWRAARQWLRLMSPIQGSHSFGADIVSLLLGAFERCPAEMATHGDGRVFAFAGRADHHRGLLDVSYSADYPARLSPSASNICGHSVDTNTKKCDRTCAYRTGPRQESQTVNGTA